MLKRQRPDAPGRIGWLVSMKEIEAATMTSITQPRASTVALGTRRYRCSANTPSAVRTAANVTSLMTGVESSAANPGCIVQWKSCTETITTAVTSDSQPRRPAASSRSFGGSPRSGGPASVVGVRPDEDESMCGPMILRLMTRRGHFGRDTRGKMSPSRRRFSGRLTRPIATDEEAPQWVAETASVLRARRGRFSL